MFSTIKFQFDVFSIVLFSCWILCFNSAYGITIFKHKEFEDNNVCVTSSDALVVDVSSCTANFIDNVRLIYGEFEIESDQLRVVGYTDDTSNSCMVNRIQEFIAEGNVKIEYDNKIAMTDVATYSREKNTLILVGYDSFVSYYGSVISGERIICYINEELFVVDTDTNIFASIMVSRPDHK